MLKWLRCRLTKRTGRFIKELLLLFVKTLTIKLAWLLADYVIGLLSFC